DEITLRGPAAPRAERVSQRHSRGAKWQSRAKQQKTSKTSLPHSMNLRVTLPQRPNATRDRDPVARSLTASLRGRCTRSAPQLSSFFRNRDVDEHRTTVRFYVRPCGTHGSDNSIYAKGG